MLDTAWIPPSTTSNNNNNNNNTAIHDMTNHLQPSSVLNPHQSQGEISGLAAPTQGLAAQGPGLDPNGSEPSTLWTIAPLRPHPLFVEIEGNYGIAVYYGCVARDWFLSVILAHESHKIRMYELTLANAKASLAVSVTEVCP